MNGNQTVNDILKAQEENFRNAPDTIDYDDIILDEGEYNALLVNVCIKALKNGEVKLFWQVKITDGQYKNKHLSNFTSIQGAYVKFTKIELKACGIQLDAFTELPNVLASGKLKNLPVLINVKKTESKGKEYNNFFIVKVLDAPSF